MAKQLTRVNVSTLTPVILAHHLRCGTLPGKAALTLTIPFKIDAFAVSLVPGALPFFFRSKVRARVRRGYHGSKHMRLSATVGRANGISSFCGIRY